MAPHINGRDSSRAVRPRWMRLQFLNIDVRMTKCGVGGVGGGQRGLLCLAYPTELIPTLCFKTESDFYLQRAATPRVFQISQAVRTSEMTVNCLPACGTQPLIPAGCSNDSVVVEGS